MPICYNAFLPAAFVFFHRARADAAILARPVALMLRRLAGAASIFWPSPFCPRILAHLARCASAIIAFAAADIVRRPGLLRIVKTPE